MNYRRRRLLSLFILLVGLPAYAVLAVSGMAFFVNLPVLFELVIYVFLGIVWVFPLKFIFRGVGQSDPER